MPHPDSFYRLRLAQDFLRIVAAPSAGLYCILHVANIRLGLFSFPAYIASVVLCAYARARYWDWVQGREARRLGARPIPQVVGKWPGNIDVYWKLLNAAQNMYLGSFHRSLFEEYKSTTLNLKLLWQDLIITMDEKHQQYVLATGFKDFWRGPRQKERLETFLGEGIFNRDGEEWKAHRALARPFFARDRVTDFELFEKYTAKSLGLISSIMSNDQPVEVQDMYARFTLDAASEFLFGHNVDTLSGQLPEPGKTHMSAKGSATEDDFGSFAQAFEAVQVNILKRARRGYFWPAYELFGRDPQAKHMEVIEKWLTPMLERVLENKSKMRDAGVRNTLDQSIFLEFLADHTEDAKVIQDQLLNILLASRDTTSSLLTSVTYFLALHPDVAKKLRAEVLEHCGVDGIPTFATIKNMRYMRAVINETLRIFPPVPTNGRESRPHACLLPKSDGTFPEPPEPMYVPPSTQLVYLTILTHRNPALWGPDADLFDPERWLDDRVSIFTANPMIFTPFSAGPRICIGQNYALNEASYFLTRLMQQFDTFTLAPEAQPEGSLPPAAWKEGKGRERIERMWPDAALTGFVKGGLWMRFGKTS
ncbi:cytochrome P450 monooxygenase CYP63 [Wolfiporia cocos MD-104 SS10]|uniref:Cytochrome P450 monooxygenase CYP63 n=1 Tax=Wolfiporia cocos (strain MD-104) TaxID=742152 RepID=A0A2H3IXD3_WOLCO|nr:cytochrome P450 monooxygenase CYP63 [Wolfiporia cocos MD-104 SS10]